MHPVQSADASPRVTSSIEQISASLEEMSAMTKQHADNSQTAARLMEETAGSVSSVSRNTARMASTMNTIQDASARTSNNVKTIDEIAFQTILLALNAAVGAARVGKAERIRGCSRRGAKPCYAFG